MKIFKIKEWLFDKINNEAKGYHMLLDGEYHDESGNRVLDHTSIHVIEVLSETEKALRVKLECTTFGGHYHSYTTWLPKSQIISIED